jgi:hypothetical protein
MWSHLNRCWKSNRSGRVSAVQDETMSYWHQVSKCDRTAICFAAPHYSIAKPLSAELGPPGQKIVLFGEDGKALWGSHRPAPWAKIGRMDGFQGHSCFIFRNDGGPQSSGIIREAVAITAIEWNLAPFITYVAIDKVKRKRDPGRCFIKAGFLRVSTKTKTKHGPMLRLEMPESEVRKCVQEFLQPH